MVSCQSRKGYINQTLFLWKCIFIIAFTRLSKECLWRLVMLGYGISADRFDDLERNADPRQILFDLVEQKKMIRLHLILLLTWKACDIISRLKSIKNYVNGYLTP